MADDLVVREWDHTDWRTWGTCTAEHNALARAYLERDAQLAASEANRAQEVQFTAMWKKRWEETNTQLTAMTAERDAYRLNAEMFSEWGPELEQCERKLTASEAAREKLRELFEEYVRLSDNAWAEDGKVAAAQAPPTRRYLDHVRDLFKRADEVKAKIREALAEPGKAGES